VIAPLNTFDGWLDKFSQMSPKTDVTVIDRKNRSAFSEALRLKRGDVFLMHWDALRLMPELQRMRFGSVVADEAHRMANRKNQWTRAIKRLDCQHKHVMSGTLSGDKPQNLWSPFNWLYPKYYSSYWRFYNHYTISEIVYPQGFRKQIGIQNVDALHDEIRPWYVRHLKKEQCCADHPQGVMPWLPDKSYDNIWVDLAPSQRRVYEEMRKHMVAWVGEHEDSPLVAQVAVVQMVRLSQMALAMPRIDQVEHFRRAANTTETVDEVHLELPSSKAEALLELLQDHPDKKFVVATSSKKMAYLCQEYLGTKKIESFVLSGDTPQSGRDGMVKRWGESSQQVWIGVIKAMGEGIDGLQWYCDTIVFLDRDWSSFWNKQCEDRLHRDGQENAVQIIDIMARNTVDLGRHQKLELKWGWIKALLDGRVIQETGQTEGEFLQQAAMHDAIAMFMTPSQFDE
jgi:SNF2 family DNA or RNA helicase